MTHNKTAFILLLFTVLIATMYFLSLPKEPDYTGYNTQQGVATIRFIPSPQPTPTPTPAGGGGSGGRYYRDAQYDRQPIQQPEIQQESPIRQETQYAYPEAQVRQIAYPMQEPTVQVIQIQNKTKFPWWQTILAIIALLGTSYLLMRKKTA
ncbi:Uncharacterised protein [uncultured archaeon]|nr:Uncharacterised protein [uncultured archaeon]